MARLRYNGLTATLGAGGLSTSGTGITFAAALTYNGAAATPVPTLSGSDYIPLTILDSSGNVSEIVYLTAYTSGATTGTISRAQEGTTGVAHNSGDKVVHGPTAADFAAAVAAEGVPMYGYGNSYGVIQSPANTFQPYLDRLASRLRSGAYANRYVNGAQMQDTAEDAIGGSNAWASGTSGLVIVDSTINDVGWQQANTQALTGYQESLRALLHVLRSGSRIDDGAFTYTGGTWATLSGQPWSGGTLHYASAAGSVATYSFTGTAFTLLTYARTDTAGATLVLKVDGATITTRNLTSIGQTSHNNPSRAYVPVAIPVTGLSAGSHAVEVSSTTAGNLHVDALLVPSATPPTVCLVKAVQPTSAAYTSFYGTGKTDASRATYNSAIDSIAAEFPADGSVLVVDPTVGWDPTVHLSNDGLHPNDRGMAHIATAIQTVISAGTWRRGLNIL